MKILARAGIGVVIATSVAVSAAAQETSARGVLTVPATGVFGRGGEFNGTISINRFERRGNEIVAIGFVTGIVRRGFRTVGTVVAGEVELPVSIRSAGLSMVRGPQPVRPHLRPAAWSPRASSAATLQPAQVPACPVLHVVVGPHTIDLLGGQVILNEVAFDLTGAPGTPVGDLMCEASELVGNVAGVVNLLNNILGLLTGLLGGLTGGVAGVPQP